MLPLGVPPLAQTITGELTGVMAGTDVDIAFVLAQVVDSMGESRYLPPSCEKSWSWVAMMIIMYPRPAIKSQVLLLSGVHTDNRFSDRITRF